jgi:hypothetical protein
MVCTRDTCEDFLGEETKKESSVDDEGSCDEDKAG